MHQNSILRYENACLMLMEVRDGAYHFIGTAFIVHSSGYLVTAAHLLEDTKEIVAVSPVQAGEFTPLSVGDTATYSVRVAQTDAARDLALLKMDLESEIGAPDDFVGNPEAIGEGVYLLAFGIPFGHYRIHNVMVMRAMLSAKILSPNESQLLLFDSRVHAGDVGGPLVNTETGRVVGVIQGEFNPLDIQQADSPEGYRAYSKFSYAVSITHVKPLLEAEGIAPSYAPSGGA